MKVKDLRDVMIHFQDRKYDKYEVVFWDSVRQKRMEGAFTGLSHPDQEISINVWDQDDKRNYQEAENLGLPQLFPSPFEPGKNAVLMIEKDYSFAGVKVDRYFYRDPSGKQFTTTACDAMTMSQYYRAKVKQYRDILTEHGIPWD